MQNGAAPMENSMEVPQKIKIELSFYPAIPLLGVFPKEKTTNLKRYMNPNIHSGIIYNSQDMEGSNYPLINEWLKRTWNIHAMEYLSQRLNTF